MLNIYKTDRPSWKWIIGNYNCTLRVCALGDLLSSFTNG